MLLAERPRGNEEDGVHSAEWALDRLPFSSLREFNVAVADVAWTDHELVACFRGYTGEGLGHCSECLFELGPDALP